MAEGEGAISSIGIDLADQVRHAHLAVFGNFLQGAPKFVFEGNTRFVTGNDDRTFCNGSHARISAKHRRIACLCHTVEVMKVVPMLRTDPKHRTIGSTAKKYRLRTEQVCEETSASEKVRN
jgi:hypothetical protein